GNLPKIPDFDKTLAVARGRGIRITMTLQSLSQLDDRYGHSTAETMRNTCNTWVYLSANDPGTARIVSEKIGQTTIATTSYGQNWQKDSRSRSENTNTTGRALLTADEVLRWRSDHTLVLQAGQMPAKFPARFWHDWPQYPGSVADRAGTNPAPVASIESPPLWTPAGPSPDAGLTFNPDGPVDPTRPAPPQTDAPRWRPA
ncbi:MAG: type IV secretory system conjugative DNA transfer family protein, partial [Sulfobacillus sp.]